MALLRNKTLLITGGAGFIGSNLCEYFMQHNRVVCLDNFSTGHRANIVHLLGHPNFNLIDGDIRDITVCRRAMQGCAVVLHQAALGSVPRSIADPVTTNSVNVDGFLNVLQAAHEAGIERFVYASSSSVYGDLEELPKKEERMGNPMSPYAVTKLVNEQYARVYHRLFGMEIIGLRYFNVFGKNQDPEGQYAAAIPRFIKGIMQNRAPVIFGDGNQSRDFTYIKNVMHANDCAAATVNAAAFGKAFNIAFGKQTTVNELVETLTREISKKNKNCYTGAPVYEQERKGDVRFSHASIDLARTVIGYKPEWSFEHGIREAVDWYVKNL